MKTPNWPDPSKSNHIDLGLERAHKALEKLGNPHLKLPPVIHVAGTNGKGSTIAFLRAMLEAAGKKCHVYTSPHLVEFNERIVLAGERISDEFLNEVIAETKNKCGSIDLTFFEGTTVAAFLAFAKTPADYVLLETGMGGRLDATNVIPKPALTIITPISYDHMEFLGDTIEKIAAEKAAIIKEGVANIVSAQRPDAFKVINRFTKDVNAKSYYFDRHFQCMVNDDGSFIYRDEQAGMGLPKPSLRGKHQYINAATAVRAAIELGIDKKHIKAGIKNAKWPARLQKLSENLYLDGGHNTEAAEIIKDFVIAENSKTDKHKKYSIAIVGMLKTKDINGFISNLAPAFNCVYAVAVPNNVCHAPSEIKQCCDRIGIKCVAFENFDEAFSKASNGAEAIKNRVVICGSLYLAGYVLENFKPSS